jgi:hypothetical protein
MHPESQSQGRLSFHGNHTNRNGSNLIAPFLNSIPVPSGPAVPEVSHRLERADRESRAKAIIAKLKVTSCDASRRVSVNLLALDDTFFASLEKLMKAVPYANEVDNSRRLISSLLSSRDRTELTRSLGASTVMYGRKDHAELLWLVQGLRSILPDSKSLTSREETAFFVVDDD